MFVSTYVSLDNSFPSVRQEPSFGPWKGSPFLPRLGQEDPLEKKMATHLSILAWRIPWSLAGHSLWGCQELDTTERLTHTRVLEGFPGGSSVESCSARDTVPSLGWEDPLEKEMATYSSIIAWGFPWTEELQSMESQRV